MNYKKFNLSLTKLYEAELKRMEEEGDEELESNADEEISEPEYDKKVIKADDTIKIDAVYEFLQEKVNETVFMSYGKKDFNMITFVVNEVLDGIKMDENHLILKFNKIKYYIKLRKIKNVKLGMIGGKTSYLLNGHEKYDDIIISG